MRCATKSLILLTTAIWSTWLLRDNLIESVLIVWMYTGSPNAERLYAEFHHTHARYHHTLARNYFRTSFAKYQQLYLQSKEEGQDIYLGSLAQLLGSQCECGKGIPIDLMTARKWYEIGAQAGNQRSKDGLKRVQATITREQ